MNYLHYRGYSCALIDAARISFCRVQIPRNATVPKREPSLPEMCRACLIELVRLGLFPSSCDPRRFVRRRVTRDLRPRVIDVEAFEDRSVA